MTEPALPLYEIYQDTFELVRVNTPELKEAAARLRYQVYCVEQPFEDPAKNPGGLEKDEYDDRSAATLLIHRKSGMLVGHVRIILPKPEDILHSFPMQDQVSLPLLKNPERVRISCEISRFCISQNFRKREGDGLYSGVFLPPSLSNPLSLFTKQHQHRVIPFMPLGLIRGILEMLVENNILWTYGLLEPQFVRLLKKLGVCSEILGPPMTYHGTRYPVELDPYLVCKNVERKNREVWKIMTNNGAVVESMKPHEKKYKASKQKSGLFSLLRP